MSEDSDSERDSLIVNMKNSDNNVYDNAENEAPRTFNFNGKHSLTNINNVKVFEPVFEKEPLEFFQKIKPNDFGDEKVYETMLDIQEKLNKTASSILYHWKNVSIVFPESNIGLSNNDVSIEYKDLFKFPTMVNELDQVATDVNGKTKKLNKKQLDAIKKEGKFEVESQNFPGQVHKWVLARFLQKGSKNTSDTFYTDLSRAIYLLIITAKNRFCSKTFSIWQGIRSIKIGITGLIDLMIGLPLMRVKSYENKLELDRLKFFISELIVDPTEQSKFDLLSQKLANASDKNKISFEEIKNIMPYFYRTTTNKLIDLRLFNTDLQKKLVPILENILKINMTERLKLEKLRNELIILFKSQNLNEDEIKNKTFELLKKEYMKYVENQLFTNTQLEKISPGIAKLLSDHSKAVILIRESQEEVNQEYDTHIKNYEFDLKKKYRVRARVSDWLNECVSKEQDKFKKTNMYKAHEISIRKLNEQGLNQAAYFIERDLVFLKEHEPDLIKNYKKIKEPCLEFKFNRLIWFPKNWKITPLVNPTENVRFALNKYSEYKNTSQYPFWRWKNFFLRTWVYFSNVFFYLGLVFPFVAGTSFRALVSINPYYPSKVLNAKTGVLEKDYHYKVSTLCSRLVAIWESVRNSRQKFEAIPDKGLIGKSVSRFFNRIWNYIFKGLIGSVGVLIIFPTICISLSVGSLFLCITSPLWYPIVSVLQHLFFIMIFDWEMKQSGMKTVYMITRLWQLLFLRLFLCGFIQPIAALSTSIFICPISSLVVTIVASLRFVFRKLYDNFMFYCFLKWRARVPSHDTFVARRVAGPGLASSYFYQMSVEQALAALDVSLEKMVIESYMSYIEKRLNEPIELYRKTFNPLFTPYSYQLTSNQDKSYPYEELQKEVQKYTTNFRKMADKRLRSLNNVLNNNNVKSTKLSEKNLAIVVDEATKLIKKRFEDIILVYEKKTVERLFIEEQVDQYDWTKLAQKYLEKIFGVGILTPIETVDCFFSLEVNHLNLAKYTSMIATSNLRDDLDEVSKIHNPERIHITINMPEENTNLFWTENASSFITRTMTVSPSNSILIPILLYKDKIKGENKLKSEYFKMNSNGLDYNAYYMLSNIFN